MQTTNFRLDNSGANYGSNENCQINILGDGILRTEGFDLEDADNADWLKVGNTRYKVIIVTLQAWI